MQVVLMAGGKGTRLRPFTNVLPKPLVPIGDMSILEMVLQQLKYFGFSDVIVSVGYKAEIIMAVVGDGHRFGLKIRYHFEEHPLGTVGALASIKDLDENFLVLNGDICSNINFAEVFAFHVDNGPVATIGVKNRKERIELGVLDLDKENTSIVNFREKPEFDFFVSMGVNVFNRQVLKFIPHDEYFGFDSLMIAMLDAGVLVKPYPFEGLWLDIGRPDDYNQMVEDFSTNRHRYLPNES